MAETKQIQAVFPLLRALSGWCMRLRFSHALLDLAKGLSQWMSSKPGAYITSKLWSDGIVHLSEARGSGLRECTWQERNWHWKKSTICVFVDPGFVCYIFLLTSTKRFWKRTPSLSLWCRHLGLFFLDSCRFSVVAVMPSPFLECPSNGWKAWGISDDLDLQEICNRTWTDPEKTLVSNNSSNLGIRW